MSNNESFIDEVTEEVRKDQLFGYMRRYGWIAVVGVLLAVGGTAFNEFRKSQQQAAAQAVGDQIFAALETDDDTARAAALADISAEGGAGAIAGLLAAADLQEMGDVAGASEALNRVASDSTTPQVYRDLAALKSVMVQGQSMAAEERRIMLEGLSAPGAPFRLMALEQLAYINIEQGETQAAIDQFVAIAQDAEVTGGLRDRAFSMIVALGGDLESLIGAAIAAAG